MSTKVALLSLAAAILPSLALANPPDPAAGSRAAPPSPDEVRKTLDLVETVALWSAPRFGVGGTLYYIPTPIVLFKSGEAVEDVEAVLMPGGLAAHRKKYPNLWTRWRREGGTIQTEHRGEWRKLQYKNVMDRLRAGTRLDGVWRAQGGGGNVAQGGHFMAVAWSTLELTKDGTFALGGGGGASDRGESGGHSSSVVAVQKRPQRGGRYEIDGYLITLRFDDGTVELRTLVTDAGKPSVLWIDGLAYTR